MPEIAGQEPIVRLKRLIYLVGLPVVAALAMISWWVERELGIIPLTNLYGLPIVSGLALLMAVVLWFRRDVRALEIAFVILGGFYLLVTLFVGTSVAYHSDHESTELLARLGYWFTPYFLMVFMVFGARRGLVVSGAILIAALAVGANHFGNPEGHMPSELLLLLQMYVSMALVIPLLSVLSAIQRHQVRYAMAMEEEANTDVLTGLSNRRHLERLIAEEIARAARYRRGLALIMFDLDHFKRVNDTHGHHVGDRVLRAMRHLLGDHIRQVDTLGRWGGEEFVVLTPEMSKEQAVALAERLRAVIGRHEFAAAGRLTASFGVSEFESGDTVATLTTRADEALYRAKQGGRDRVVAGD